MMLVQKNKDGNFARVEGNTIVAPNGSKIAHSALLRAIEKGDTALMQKFGVEKAERVAVPEGKMATGAERIEVRKGKPVVVRDLEDAPPPPPEPTRAAKFEAMLSSYGLTGEEFLAEVAARQTGKEPR